ncbi:MAG: dihydrofolate reductase, partial [Candidatus ainarchaeum sp.]|nr:dihydrofolate reductase [Candidatus ainarchaeum sp.]
IKNSLEDAINFGHSINEKIYIIGGASIYKQSIEIATKLEITRIDQEYLGDTFFPEIDLDVWKIIKEEKHQGYSFLTYIRK